MNINPYQPPASGADDRHPDLPQRGRAKRDVRAALLILLLPAVYNFLCFHFWPGMNRGNSPIPGIYRAMNAAGFVSLAIAVWFLGLIVLELATKRLHAALSAKSQPNEWLGELYKVLRRVPVFAIFGAVLWCIWVAAFYQFDLDFYAISNPIGMAANALAANALAAGVYLPLFYRWYRIG